MTTGRGKEKVAEFAKAIKTAAPSVKGVLACVNKRRDNVILSSEYHLLEGEATIEEKVGELTFSVSSASFFQVNPAQAEQLYRIVIDLAELTPESTLLDAYCGVGTLALLAADKVKKVVGVEIVEEAIADAKENAKRNGITNATFICTSTEKAELSSSDVVFLNPPRKGCHADVLYALLQHRPNRIVYISCDPATLARDLKILSSGYTIDKVQPIDMFPQTAHVETVVRLTAK